MFEVKRLHKNYKDFNLDVSLTVPSGTITGIIGPNGAGKSTLFKSVLKLIKSDAEKIIILDKDVTSEKDLGLDIKNRIGVVLAESGFSGYITAADAGKIMAAMYENFDADKFDRYCRELDLPMNKQIKDFSTGMKAKLKVIAALTHNADLLILDEPTAGLDVMARDDILDLLREYIEEKEDRSIIISSHISTDLEGLCDDLYMIKKGSIILHEEVDAITSEYAMIKVDKDAFDKLDKNYILRYIKDSFGYACLTNERQFYMENYPELVIERCSIDNVIQMMMKGAAL